ncbi:MAG: CBS domain-containing protein [Acidobacteriota bacterium]|nr:CBS domain-containing protein [Acidobacteriota bacterium]
MAESIRQILNDKGSNVWSIPPEATVYDAIAMMMEKAVGALLVMKAGVLAGIISERDYARKVILQERSSRETSVTEIMTRNVVTVSPEYSVEECMRIMTECRIRHLPVLEEGRVLGIVSIGDLVKAIITAQADTIVHLHTYIGGTYPS